VEVDVALGLRERELDTLADLRGLRGDGEVGKVLERERRVGRGALLEEGSGKREDLRALERGVERRRSAVLALEGRDESLVASLDREDGTGSSQVSLAVNERGLAEVGGYSNALENARGSEEGLDAVVAKVVGAWLGGLNAERAENALEGSDVGSLLCADLSKSLRDRGRVVGILEVVRAVPGEALLVEGSLEVLKGERVLEDKCREGWRPGRRPLKQLRQQSRRGE